MEKGQKRRSYSKLMVLSGGAALLAVAVNIAIFALNSRTKTRKKKEIRGSKFQVNLSAQEILKLADHIIAKSKEVHDAVASVPLDKVCFANVIEPLAELEAQQFPLVQSCVFRKYVSPAEDVRKASLEAERRIDAHVSVCSKREDVYRVVKAVMYKGDWISPEAKQFVQFLVQDFERNGLNLTSTKREELQRLKTDMNELSLQYIRNLNDSTACLIFSQVELAGLPQDFIKSLDEAEKGSYKITLRSQHVFPVLDFCRVGSTRKAVAVGYGQRCEANLSLLEKLIQLRHKLSRLLGYVNYVEYAIDQRMTTSSSKVFEFLENISASLTNKALRELDVLKELKRLEEGVLTFGIEDLRYYMNRARERQFDLDFGAVMQYFPVNLVLSGIFKICEDLFGLRFEEVADADVWNPDVQLFVVFDLRSGELMGYFYLDLYSREGKYGHTCVISLQNYASISSGRLMPIALLLSQMEKGVEGNPGLLRFSEVVNLFHEFGHVVHHICNRASFVRFSGLHLDPDFVEIPAQVLENWCYERLSLKLISGFHQDITKPIDDKTCELLKEWRFSFSALRLKQEILYCLFDQMIHSAENVDIVKAFEQLHPKVMLGLPVLEGTDPASYFPGTAIGYEGTCYSRIWSEVFAADIFSSKFSDNLLDQHTGMQFRSKVMAPGAGKDPFEMLSDFLGRDPSMEAFLRSRTESS